MSLADVDPRVLAARALMWSAKIAAVAAAGALAWHWTPLIGPHARIGGLDTKLTAARAALKDPATGQTWEATAGQCKNNAQTLSEALDRQNGAVAAWQQAGQRASQAATEAVRAAGVAADTAQAQASAILAARPGDDRCASALELIRGN